MKTVEAIYCEGCGKLVDLEASDYIELNRINLDFHFPRDTFPVLNFDFTKDPENDRRVVCNMTCFTQAAQMAYRNRREQAVAEAAAAAEESQADS